MNRSFVKLAFAAAAAMTVVAAQAQSFTVATFADPTLGMANPTPMFFVSPALGDGTLSGGWTGDGLTLQTYLGDYSDVEFEVLGTGGGSTISTTQVVPGFYNVGEGSVRFYNAGDSNILTIAFDSAFLAPNGVGGADLWGNNVTFTGTIAPAGTLSGEAFGFAFANPTATDNGVSYTASFTSSAVPEPASLAALGIGAVALLRRRKRA